MFQRGKTRQILGRGQHVARAVTNLAANQRRILRFTGAQRHVIARLHQILYIIGNTDIERNVRVSALKFRIQMRQQRRANSRRGSDAQPSTGIIAQALNGVFRPLAGRQHLAAMHQIVLARKS
ncbi:hypothetical protein D3C85_1452310 [compost metagenome]